jgi:hypothetical protein
VQGTGAPCVEEVPAWGQRRRRGGPNMAAAARTMDPGGGGDDRVSMVAACAPVASLAVQR